METIEAIKTKYSGLSEEGFIAVIARLLSENGYLDITVEGDTQFQMKVAGDYTSIWSPNSRFTCAVRLA